MKIIGIVGSPRTKGNTETLTRIALEAAEEAGVYVVGYNNDMSRFAPTRHLTAPIWDWGVVYNFIAEEVIKGSWKSEDIWWGLKEGIVGLAPFSKDVPKFIRRLVAEEKDRIMSGKWDVFTGPIKGQDGDVIVSEGKSMSDREMLSMDLFVEGVEGEIPR